MSTFNPRTFTVPGILRSIKPDLLIRFLSPYREYLESLGAILPTEPRLDLLDYDELHLALSAAGASNPPPALADSMAAIDDLASPEGSDALEGELVRENPEFRRPENIEDVNFVMMVWLENPEAIERVNARNFAFQGRSYLAFKVDPEAELPPFIAPDTTARMILRDEIAERFAHIYPADSFRVTFHLEGSGGRFVVRHGGPLVREGIVDPLAPEKSESRIFRRELFDVLIYTAAERELRVHARSKRDCDIYTRAFGVFLAGDEAIFPDADRYTLRPLITQRNQALACANIQGLGTIKLTEITITIPGAIKESITHRATDVFQIPSFRESGIPVTGALVKARFNVRVTGAKRDRTVTIIVPNKAQYKRDSDGELVEKWLRSAGFVQDSALAPASDLNVA